MGASKPVEAAATAGERPRDSRLPGLRDAPAWRSSAGASRSRVGERCRKRSAPRPMRGDMSRVTRKDSRGQLLLRRHLGHAANAANAAKASASGGRTGENSEWLRAAVGRVPRHQSESRATSRERSRGVRQGAVRAGAGTHACVVCGVKQVFVRPVLFLSSSALGALRRRRRRSSSAVASLAHEVHHRLQDARLRGGVHRRAARNLQRVVATIDDELLARR